MKRLVLLGLVLSFVSLPASRLYAFDTVALVDSLDFAAHFDIETDKGNMEVFEHVLRNHVNDIWWRDKSGGKMRYPSKCESWPITETPFDKRRLPCEDIWGYLRLDAPRANAFPLVRRECEKRGIGFGIHTTTEENHWCSQLSANWTIDHPRFWTCTRGGTPFHGIVSYAWPEVIAHKMEMVDERLAMKPQTIFLDTWRNGGWSAAYEYTKPMVAEWRKLYGCEPPEDPNDPRWTKLVGSHVLAYFRKFSARCRAAGVRFVVGFHHVDGKGDAGAFKGSCVDWKELAREGIADAIVIMSVEFDKADPFGSTERIYRYVMENRGKAEIYFPVTQYNFFRTGIPEYAKLAKVSEAEAVKRLMKLAKDAGARGVVMECVDYRNYSDAECAAIAEALK